MRRSETPVGAAGHPCLAAGELDVLRGALEQVGGDTPRLVRHAGRRGQHGRGADAREPRGVGTGSDRPGARRRVHVGQDLDLLGRDPERVGGDLGGHGAVTLALRCRRDPDADASVGADLHARPVRVARLRQAQGPLLGRLGQRDVAHVRDRRLDHAGEADTDEPAFRACARLLLAPLVVAGELQDVVQARRVVARVVERRPWGCGRGARRRGRDCAWRGPPGRCRGAGRRSPSSARGRGRAGGRRSPG